MSYIPNVREKEINGRENPYYEGNLNEDHKRLIDAYDKCVEDAENFFSNLDVFWEELSVARFNTMYVQHDLIRDCDIDKYTLDELVKMTPETKTVIAFKAALLYWLEIQRNELAVSFLDDQAEI